MRIDLAKSFHQLKVNPVNRPVVKIFDLTKDITSTADTSENLISGMLQGDSIMSIKKIDER